MHITWVSLDWTSPLQSRTGILVHHKLMIAWFMIHESSNWNSLQMIKNEVTWCYNSNTPYKKMDMQRCLLFLFCVFSTKSGSRWRPWNLQHHRPSLHIEPSRLTVIHELLPGDVVYCVSMVHDTCFSIMVRGACILWWSKSLDPGPAACTGVYRCLGRLQVMYQVSVLAYTDHPL